MGEHVWSPYGVLGPATAIRRTGIAIERLPCRPSAFPVAAGSQSRHHKQRLLGRGPRPAKHPNNLLSHWSAGSIGPSGSNRVRIRCFLDFHHARKQRMVFFYLHFLGLGWLSVLNRSVVFFPPPSLSVYTHSVGMLESFHVTPNRRSWLGANYWLCTQKSNTRAG
ncbi:hypothetical protein K431DRAFT_43946 [Polychaeton citri CBS 116435]|uniref:Uncharacterized protein n=1 Tax=Polychaeton citri CBS 116435 TaxID=1314669 RepID=A0A9P4QCL6_9PEZI|nr:hypothetical protein K431DRAFT_43946 [Polychaeton citri CBS 116435]